MKPAVTVFISIFCSLAAFAQFHYIKKGNGVQIATQKGTLLLEPYSDSIIRVRFVPGDRIIEKKEIAIVQPHGNTPWQLEEEKDLLQLKTAAIIATVNGEGQVQFLDKNDHLLLSELPDGRRLMPTTDQESATYRVTQAFQIGDEALYGLGQYQNGLVD